MFSLGCPSWEEVEVAIASVGQGKWVGCSSVDVWSMLVARDGPSIV